MKKELSSIQIFLIVLVLSIFFVGIVVGAVNLTLGKMSKELIAENRSLKEQCDTLNIYLANKDSYMQDTEDNKTTIQTILNRYTNGITAIRDLVDLDKYKEDYNMESVSATFGTVIPYETDTILEGKINVEDKEYTLLQSDLSIAYTMSYDSLKTFIDDFPKYNYALTNLSLSFDETTGNLTGTMNMKEYAIEGEDKQYQNPNLDIDTGVENLFGTK